MCLSVRHCCPLLARLRLNKTFNKFLKTGKAHTRLLTCMHSIGTLRVFQETPTAGGFLQRPGLSLPLRLKCLGLKILRSWGWKTSWSRFSQESWTPLASSRKSTGYVPTRNGHLFALKSELLIFVFFSHIICLFYGFIYLFVGPLKLYYPYHWLIVLYVIWIIVIS